MVAGAMRNRGFERCGVGHPLRQFDAIRRDIPRLPTPCGSALSYRLISRRLPNPRGRPGTYQHLTLNVPKNTRLRAIGPSFSRLISLSKEVRRPRCAYGKGRQPGDGKMGEILMARTMPRQRRYYKVQPKSLVPPLSPTGKSGSNTGWLLQTIDLEKRRVRWSRQ